MNDWNQTENSLLKHTLLHNEMYAPGNLPKYYRAYSSFTTLKNASEGLMPFELINSKFRGTIHLPVNDQLKGIGNFYK